MTKILFTDLDGTLLTTDKQISAYTRSILDKWCSAGHKLVLCSGRPLPSIKEVRASLQLSYPGMYLIAFNGGCIYECDTDTVLAKDSLPLPWCDYILQTARSLGVYCHTYSATDILSPKDGEELAFYRQTIHMSAQFDPQVMPLLSAPPCKCLAVELHDKSRLEALRLALLPWAEGKCTLLYSNDYLLEIFPVTAGKGASVRKLCSLLNLPLSDALAAGDQENDLSMLLTAGTGIGMKNGIESIKKAADIITPSDNDHDGLAHVLERFL